ncbi:MAG TPA: methionine synthase [Elusimicrobia bacterium]|nr:MAG: hypothetical protein A2X37_04930 [Elusimicrobia bacterium GWA2_66_18]OGR76899.1 MAG: hypothetical protein A2X40_03870 [Elusimicrobia bacterium GWC2_65_9]HBL17093.1 methionine synthase [Elusimicrobiota bacterium]
MTAGLLERLRAGQVLVADGAMGTMLQERGLKPGDCPEAVNLERPVVLEEIARLYLEAGADLVQTNTFGGSPMKLAQYGLDDRTEEVNRSAVEAVRRAVGGQALVSFSCGPTGRMLKPYGDADPEEVRRAFCRQLKAAAAAGADVVCVETMTDLGEAVLAVEASKSAAPGVPVMATMTFDRTKKGYRTIMGVSVAQAAEGLAKAGADVVGSNCGNGIDNMVEIAREFLRSTRIPLLVQSNAGMPEMRGGRAVYGETPELMASKVAALLEAGANIIGGCCGTTPAHIAAIRKAVSAKSPGR